MFVMNVCCFYRSLRLRRDLGGVTEGFVGCVSMLHDATSNINFKLGSGAGSLILEGRDISEL